MVEWPLPLPLQRARKTDAPPGHMHTNQRARARFMPDWSHWTTEAAGSILVRV